MWMYIPCSKPPCKRIINQFHYTAWPDHGTPEELSLIQFHRKVTKKFQTGSPLLVHCSAGVGRTGTYIGLDSLFRQGKALGRINVFDFVKQMREERMTMIQTPDQYVFLHKALQCGFQGEDTTISERDFVTTANKLLNDESPLNQRSLYKEFKSLLTLRRSCQSEDKVDITKDEDKDKDVLPISKHRPYLTSFVKGRTDYINAIFVPSFVNDVGLIITQTPPPQTEVDVWRLCMDHDVEAIVTLDCDEAHTLWLPRSGLTRSCPPYTIVSGNTGVNIQGILQDTITISKDGQNKDVHLFQIPCGTSYNMLKGVELLLDKLGLQCFTSVIISRDGAGSAGIFCVLHNALQQLRMDGEVDIFIAVRQIHTRRPGVITELEEYRQCYQLVSEFLSTEGIYVNQ